jgi:hypothetical protein
MQQQRMSSILKHLNWYVDNIFKHTHLLALACLCYVGVGTQQQCTNIFEAWIYFSCSPADTPHIAHTIAPPLNTHIPLYTLTLTRTARESGVEASPMVHACEGTHFTVLFLHVFVCGPPYALSQHSIAVDYLIYYFQSMHTHTFEFACATQAQCPLIKANEHT